jgi:hypothetical protein
LASDFAAIYFPAQDPSHLGNAYSHDKTLDPWGRASRSAPLDILVCSLSVCRLQYGDASVLHILIQTLLFYLILYWAMRRLEIDRYFLMTASFANLCLFLTPVGLSWMERGQFSLYVASAYLLLMMGFITKEPTPVALAALLAFVKWTSFPASFVILAVFLVNSKNLIELKQRLFLTGVFCLTLAMLLLVPAAFASGTGSFLQGLLNQEMHDEPTGLSLLKYAPPLVVKLLPLILVVFGAFVARRERGSLMRLIPYAIGVAAMLIVYPTKANDYSVPTLLGFIPLMLLWMRQPDLQRGALAAAAAFVFALFLLVASFSVQLTHSLDLVVTIYIAFAVCFLVGPSLASSWLYAPATMT